MRKSLILFVSALAFLLTSSGYATFDIIWVSDAFTPAGDFAAGENVDPALQAADTPWDQGWVDLLMAQGYNVDYQKGASPGDGYWRTLDQNKLDVLNAADLVIVSRDSSSGSYGENDEPAQWNSITTPMILMNTYIGSSSRWKWLNSTSLAGDGDSPMMDVAGVPESVFTGLEILDETIGTGNTSFITTSDGGNGLVLSIVDMDFPSSAEGGVDDLAGSVWIVEWSEGVEFYDGAGQIAGGPRLLFTAGTREGTDDMGVYWGAGMYNLTSLGEALFLNVVTNIPEPATIALLGLGGLVLLGIRWRRR